MQRENGTVIQWHDEKGYGIIESAAGGKYVFLHDQNLRAGSRRPRLHKQVTYLVELSHAGKHRALDVDVCRFAWPFLTLLLVCVLPFFALYAYGVWRHMVPLYPAALTYIGMSLITIVVYHHDACAAKTGAFRVSEKELHALEIFCGWPGAFLAQLFFRHKLKKTSYQVTFWLIVIAHGVAWYLIASGLTVQILEKEIPDTITSLEALFQPSLLPETEPTNAPEHALQPPDPTPPQPPKPVLLPNEVPWTNDVPDVPLLIDPTVHRALTVAPKQFRRLAGEIKAVSASRGILVSLPPDIEADGLIAPSTLVADFHRRFRVGEQITVAIRRISMKGRHKQVELLLVEH